MTPFRTLYTDYALASSEILMIGIMLFRESRRHRACPEGDSLASLGL